MDQVGYISDIDQVKYASNGDVISASCFAFEGKIYHPPKIVYWSARKKPCSFQGFHDGLL